MRVHHVDCGTMCPYNARLVNGSGGWFEPGKMVCHVLIVETNDGLLLVDSGLGTKDIEAPVHRLGRQFLMATRAVLRREQTALARVEALGFKPSDVRHIVPTHLDLDHAGGISDFPDASVHVFEPELRAAIERKTVGEKHRYRPPHFEHGPRWVEHKVEGDTWMGFDRVKVIGEDVALIPLVGHTRGHCAVAVREEGRWLLHAGDAYFHRNELDAAAPSCPPGLAFFQWLVAIDDDVRRRNQARLRQLARDHAGTVKIFSAHDPVELDGFA
jgi:glyoxylase-like metal-dependent hydrolase (beta-lactamase superfamily II)